MVTSASTSSEHLGLSQKGNFWKARECGKAKDNKILSVYWEYQEGNFVINW